MAVSPPHPHDMMIDANGVRLAVRDYGGPRPDLLFLHGGPGPNLGSWDVFARRLCQSFRCVAYDHRGHGQSDHSDDYSYAAFIADVRAVIIQVGLERPILVGHSWGGMIALQFAAACPGESSGVIAVDGIVPPNYEPLSNDAWIWLEKQFRTDAYISRLLTFVGSAEELEQTIAWARAHPTATKDQFSEPSVRRDFIQRSDGLWQSTQSADHLMYLNRHVEDQPLPGLEMYRQLIDPVLCVMATDGKFAPSAIEEIQDIAPDIGVAWVSSGHSVQDDAPDHLIELIEDFVGTCWQENAKTGQQR